MLRYFTVFIFCSTRLFSQDPDTLLNHILKVRNDTECVNQLYAKGYDLVDKDPKSANEFARNCERIAAKSGSLKHISKSYNLAGILYTNSGNYKKALDYFEKYMAVNKQLNNTLLLAYGHTNFGNIYLRLKDFEKAESSFLSAIECYNTLGNKTELANGLINLGVLKHQQYKLDAAKENYERALQMGKELNDYDIKAICLNNLAQIFADQGNYEKALAYNYDALELRELMGLDVDVADSHLSIAEIALKQKDLPLAEENLNSALTLCNNLEYLEGKMQYHKLLSELYVLKNNYQLAYANLKLFTELDDSLMLMEDEETGEEINETTAFKPIHSHSGIRNLWLLSLLSLILVIIPFVLIRYKR